MAFPATPTPCPAPHRPVAAAPKGGGGRCAGSRRAVVTQRNLGAEERESHSVAEPLFSRLLIKLNHNGPY